MISKLFAKAYSMTQWRKSNYNKGIMADLYAIPSERGFKFGVLSFRLKTTKGNLSCSRAAPITLYLVPFTKILITNRPSESTYSVNLLIAEYSAGPLRSLPIMTPLSSTR